ncbi:hypothetical protein UFOVP1_50 [uncultured Caudovirales phage]|uniref:Bacteriophage P22, Gp10, DNA-stabilising n=1 Tax=uncultured Caudovirales phage TaxID=2100421 RepID=A0A6J5KHG1_9CAUD|nr:hypothetical protein UFOVP1_50 [uncultured Caudovirales phage]
MTKIPLQITGGSYQNPSRPANYQRCVNMYSTTSGASDQLEVSNKLNQGRGGSVLLRTMGCSIIGNVNTVDINPTCRGLYQIEVSAGNYITIVIMGAKVYNLNFNSTDLTINPVLLGSLQTVAGLVSVTSNTTQIMFICYDFLNILVGGSIYNYSAGTFSDITDPNFVGGSTVAMIDDYFIYNQVGTQSFWFSNVNDGTTYNALNVAAKSGKPDNVVALGQTKGELWVFGTDTVEVWYDAGNSPGSPFSKRIGSDLDIGCSAAFSIANVNGNLMWLDSRRFVAISDYSAFFRNQSTGYTITKASTEAIDAEFASYSKVSDAIASTYNDNGHIMYEITFPTVKKTWVFDNTINMWHEKSYYNTQENLADQAITNFYVQNESYLLAASLNNNNIYVVSRDYLDDAGQAIHRIRTTQHYNNAFNNIGVDQLELKCDCGKAPLTITNPMISMRYSNDSGYTWSSFLPRTLGNTGQYGTRITWNCLGSAHEWLFEFTISDPIDFSILDGVADVNVGSV